MNRKYPKIILSEEGEKWLDNGQMWMYKNNAVDIDETIENGSLVDIMTTRGRYMGTGFISKNSHITVRILSKKSDEIIDRDFFKKRIQFAYDFRKAVLHLEYTEHIVHKVRPLIRSAVRRPDRHRI